MEPYTETLKDLEDGTREVVFRNTAAVHRFVDEKGRSIKQALGIDADPGRRYDITGVVDSSGQMVEFYKIEPSQ